MNLLGEKKKVEENDLKIIKKMQLYYPDWAYSMKNVIRWKEE